MRLEHYPEDKLRAEVLRIIGKYLDLASYRIFFFGSRVSKTNSPSSDIDIGIEGPDEIPGHIRIKILDELEELPTLYRFDVVDFKMAAPLLKLTAIEKEYVNR